MTKNLMPKLKRLAAKLNCTVDDDLSSCCLTVDADDGWSWEEGERSCCVEAYGSLGSYLPEWRQEAIAEMIERLEQEPPEPVSYKY